MKAFLQGLPSLLFSVLFLLTGPTLLLVLWIPTIALWAAASHWFLLPIVLLPVAAVAGIVFAVRSLQRARHR